jgi:quercetin dioxygenase-like cupin family protein
MNTQQFEQQLVLEGFQEVVSVAREANGSVDLHSHPFEAKALITAGNLRISVDGVERDYKVGDVFHLQPNVPHIEHYGAQGVTYLVGRKT